MKYGYLVAYTDIEGNGFTEKEPWIHPTNPLRKNRIINEYKYVKDVVKAKHVVMFRVELDNIPENITWEFVGQNKINNI